MTLPIYEKLEDITLKVTTTPEVEEEVKEYNLDFLKEQELSIIKQKNDFIEARNTELEEVKTLIAKCEELGVKTSIEIEEAKSAELELTEK